VSRGERDAARLIRDVQREVRQDRYVLIEQARKKTLIHRVTQTYSNGTVRTETGDIWVVRPCTDKKGIDYVAIR